MDGRSEHFLKHFVERPVDRACRAMALTKHIQSVNDITYGSSRRIRHVNLPRAKVVFVGCVAADEFGTGRLDSVARSSQLKQQSPPGQTRSETHQSNQISRVGTLRR